MKTKNHKVSPPNNRGGDAPQVARSEALKPPDRFPVAFRAYVPHSEATTYQRSTRRPVPTDWTLVFDCETTVDHTQRLRFGTYAVYFRDALHENGIFFNDTSVTDTDKAVLVGYVASHPGLQVRSTEDFIERVFFRYGYHRHGSIVGFNLPFDISRLAWRHGSAHATTNRRTRKTNRRMQGGFTFRLSRDEKLPYVQIRHRSRRSAFIQFAAAKPQRTSANQRQHDIRKPVFRGFFIDVRTLAAALTSESHSLESLGRFLGIKDQKLRTEEHGGPLTEEYVEYALRDVAATWACFAELRQRYDDLRLTRTPMYVVQSEAGIGKAHLAQMNVRPWRTLQPDYPAASIGRIMSAYYGGRAEVHIRRVITQVEYCDFLSMYPTVCVLMGLWRFLISDGITEHDSTENTRTLLESATLADLQIPTFWRRVHTLVLVQPDQDIFPVRGAYDGIGQYTIGVNYLTSDQPLWFALADCLASKLLTGKAPKVLRAITYSPGDPQSGLRPIDVMGSEALRIDPVQDDFYRELIRCRSTVKRAAKRASGRERERLEVEQHVLKIIANSASYGIFMELNVEQLTNRQELVRYGIAEAGVPKLLRKAERPGRYFHPLLGTLITSAARLMLAITERLALDAGLDWAFCDTDSMALAKPTDMPVDEFYARTKTVRDWFVPLNPYGDQESVLKLEDENFAFKGGKLTNTLERLFAYPVSAKRYALFNRDAWGRPVLRKGLAHGLGHYLEPYGDDKAPKEFPKPVVPLRTLKTKRWQHDVWIRQINAALKERDDRSDAVAHRVFRTPAASRYHATKPRILRWFNPFNRGRPQSEQVWPFNFMLAFQPTFEAIRRAYERAATTTMSKKARSANTKRIPRPVAPYDRDVAKAARHAFDRTTGQPVPSSDLMNLQEGLAQFFVHPESKFLNGGLMQRGVLQRRHVQIDIANIHYIGKESNEFEEQFYLGFDQDEEVAYGKESEVDAAFLELIRRTDNEFGRRAFAKAAGISFRHLTEIVAGRVRLTQPMVAKLKRAMARLGADREARRARESDFLIWARQEVVRIGLRELARRLRRDPANLAKVLEGRRRPTEALMRAAEYSAGDPPGNGTP